MAHLMACPSCLLCLTNCGKEDNVATGSPIFMQRQLSYKMLLRYLKIDVFKLGSFSSSFGTFLDGGSEGGNANLEVLLCSNCSAVTIEFLELFQVFDEARLRLDEICGELLSRIREGEQDQGRLEEYRKSLKNVSQLSGKPVDALLNYASLAERLRNETKQKCSERLNKSIPKVTLSRGDSAKRRKIDSCTVSKETDVISEKITENENLIEDPNLELATDKSLSSQQVKVEVANPLPEDDNDSMETELLDTITFHRSEVEDGPPIQDPQTLPPSPTIGSLPLSPKSRSSPPEPALASSSSSKELGGKCHQLENTSKERDYLREHMILVNLLITFAPRIPPNTTVVQVQSAINSIAFGKKRILKKTDGKFSCTICPQKFPWANRLRTHIFLNHFNQVLDLLLGRVEVEVDDINSILKTILENATGNKGTSDTSQDQLSDPLGNEEEQLFQDIPQLADKNDEETLDLEEDPLNCEDPLMDKPSSSQQTKERCPALNPTPTTAFPAGIPVPITLTPKPTYFCSKCDKAFVSNEHLLKHKVEAHMDTNVLPQFFMCSKCRKVFRNRALLGTHIKTVHTFEFFKNQLPPLASEADLDQVINSFVLLRKAFSSSSVGGGGTAEDIVGCRICCGQYVLLSQRSQLRVHILEKHFQMVASTIVQEKSGTGTKSGDRKGEEEGEKCLCRICSQDFITDHSTTNANETVFECNYCGKLFPGRGNLRFHLVISHPIIVFSGELPPGTSESELNKVVDNLDDKTTGGTGLQAKFECTFCPRRYAKRLFIRPHILHKHFDQILKHLRGGGTGGEEAELKPELLKPPTPAEAIQIGLSTIPHSTSTPGAAPLLGSTFQLGTNNGVLSLFVMPHPPAGNI